MYYIDFPAVGDQEIWEASMLYNKGLSRHVWAAQYLHILKIFQNWPLGVSGETTAKPYKYLPDNCISVHLGPWITPCSLY